ncbi:MAG: CrcB family protein [Paludibacteraceae bacterium]|nr:CrcB family protein [Paludibacteraceae bacterium]
MLRNFFIVGLGGALGSMMRYGVTLLGGYLSLFGPLSTLCVNSIGSFLITLFAALVSKETTLLLLTVGFCGGFTTYSTFSSQSLQLIQAGKFQTAMVYILATLLVCLFFSWLGFMVGGRLK